MHSGEGRVQAACFRELKLFLVQRHFVLVRLAACKTWIYAATFLLFVSQRNSCVKVYIYMDILLVLVLGAVRFAMSGATHIFVFYIIYYIDVKLKQKIMMDDSWMDFWSYGMIGSFFRLKVLSWLDEDCDCLVFVNYCKFQALSPFSYCFQQLPCLHQVRLIHEGLNLAIIACNCKVEGFFRLNCPMP